MASSNKSTVLGLNLWLPEDKPKREDFVSDNTKLENLVGSHLNNGELHLSVAEKAFLDSPMQILSYTGTGTRSKSFTVDFEAKAAVAFPVDRAPWETVNGVNYCRFGFAVQSAESTGVHLVGRNFTVYQQDAAKGVTCSLNESGVNYTAILIR